MQAYKNKNAKNLEPLIKLSINPGLNTGGRNLVASDQELDKGENWTKSLIEDLS